MLEIHDLQKSFGDLHVLRGINLNIQKGDVVAVLGSSGSGKTTLLRCMNFLEHADAGTMVFDGQQVELSRITHAQIHALRRRTGFVFQNYNLFANKTALQNVTEGLVIARKMDKHQADEIARAALDKVGMGDRCDHYPSQLSGGQQQRVALARAIVTRPKVLLLDEPLSAIDAKLRKSLQVEIRRIQKQLNITTIFVTHDQDEAMVMSDRICLLNCGKIEQMDTPIAIYTHPRTKFAAGFIGSYNVLEPLEFGRVTGDIDLPAQPIAIRPEVLNIAREKQNLPGTYDIEGTVIDSTPRGNVLRYKVDVNGVQLSADTLFRSFSIYENGSKVWLSLEKRNCLHVEEEAV